jgi:hypothetical protein
MCIVEATLENILLTLTEIPGMIALAASATNPDIREYSTKS